MIANSSHRQLNFQPECVLNNESYDGSLSFFEDVLQHKDHKGKVVLFIPEHELSHAWLGTMGNVSSLSQPPSPQKQPLRLSPKSTFNVPGYDLHYSPFQSACATIKPKELATENTPKAIRKCCGQDGVLGRLLVLDDESHLPTIDTVLEQEKRLNRVHVNVEKATATDNHVCVKGTVHAYVWHDANDV